MSNARVGVHPQHERHPSRPPRHRPAQACRHRVRPMQTLVLGACSDAASDELKAGAEAALKCLAWSVQVRAGKGVTRGGG